MYACTWRLFSLKPDFPQKELKRSFAREQRPGFSLIFAMSSFTPSFCSYSVTYWVRVLASFPIHFSHPLDSWHIDYWHTARKDHWICHWNSSWTCLTTQPLAHIGTLSERFRLFVLHTRLAKWKVEFSFASVREHRVVQFVGWKDHKFHQSKIERDVGSLGLYGDDRMTHSIVTVFINPREKNANLR